jgi:hypothetical protein
VKSVGNDCRGQASRYREACLPNQILVQRHGVTPTRGRRLIALPNLVQGPHISLTDVESLCAFARFCDPHGQVWNLVLETDRPSAKKNFVRQVEECPSGRLVAWDNSTGKSIEPKFEPSIGLIEDQRISALDPYGSRAAYS